MIRSHNKTIVEAIGRQPIHPFPARMAPGIALDLLSGNEKRLFVIDPMSGSGTVLAVARSKGHRAVGVDLDPLAVLIARVWTTAINKDFVRNKALKVLRRAKKIFEKLSLRAAYPINADPETKDFVVYWFDTYARRQLASLATAISRVGDQRVRDVLWCGFSRLIITKQSGASLAMDLSHSRPHKAFESAPIKPFNKFIAAVDRVCENCIDVDDEDRGPAARVINGDARSIPVAGNSVDMVLTSPPYLNAIDYMRCSKFSLIWMGYRIGELRDVRTNSVGAEIRREGSEENDHAKTIVRSLKLVPKLSGRHESILLRYIDDMHLALSEVARVLKPGGVAVYVVGENTIKGTYVRNSKILCSIARVVGLNFEERRTRALPANRRYLPPPIQRKTPATMNVRIRREVVLKFRKPSVMR